MSTEGKAENVAADDLNTTTRSSETNLETAASSTRRRSKPSLSLHDALALGEIELGLSNSAASSADESTTKHHIAELQRLPYLLRLLSKTRPLVTIPSLQDPSRAQESEVADAPNNLNPSENNSSSSQDDPLVEAVRRLEHVAARYSTAEGVDVVTNYLLPVLTKSLSQLPPLVKDTSPGNNNYYKNTESLIQAAKYNPKASAKRRKRSAMSAASSSSDGQQDHPNKEEQYDSDVEMEDVPITSNDTTKEETEGPHQKKQKIALERRDSIGPDGSSVAVAEDSLEATVSKTLTELVTLVVHSLVPVQPIHLDEADDGGDQEGGGEHHHHSSNSNNNSSSNHDDPDHPQTQHQHGHRLLLAMDDSILSESGKGGIEESVGAAMGGSDLGSTIASIMHHAPVLRSQHVANALCRAAVPQAGDLIARIGANCPSSTASLLLGCIDAYKSAIDDGDSSIAVASKRGVMALSKLSQREQTRVLVTLQRHNVLLSTQLELAMKSNAVSAASLMIQNLSDAICTGSLEDVQESVVRDQQDMNTSKFRVHDPTSRHRKVEPSLLQSFRSDQELLQTTLGFLKKEMIECLLAAEDGISQPGKLCLLLKAFSWLLAGGIINGPHAGFVQKTLMDDMLPILQTLWRGIEKMTLQRKEEAANETSSMDPLFRGAFCSSLLTLVNCCRDTESQQLPNEYLTLLSQYSLATKISHYSARLVSRFLGLLESKNGSLIYLEVVKLLSRQDITQGTSIEALSECFKPSFECLCKCFQELERGRPIDAGCLMDQLSKIHSIVLSANEQGDCSQTCEQVRKTLQNIMLQEDSSINFQRVLDKDELARFVVVGTKYLSGGHAVIPVIMASDLERACLDADLSLTRRAGSINDKEGRFLLILLYSFQFYSLHPHSPFAFNHRDFPVAEAFSICQNLSPSDGFLLNKLQFYVEKFCPYVVRRESKMRLCDASTIDWPSAMSRSDHKEQLFDAVSEKMLQAYDADESFCLNLEALFLDKQSRLSSSELATTIVSAFLSSTNLPPLFVTYKMLYQDPLILLRSPLKVWQQKSLRRIGLSILGMLLEINTFDLLSFSPSEEAASELISARNAVIVRSFLVVMSAHETGTSRFYCPTMEGMIRGLVAECKGVVALLVKQGIPDSVFDWLVEFVPECMGDSQPLLQLLSERSSLTPAERICAADPILRIAIAHGHQNEPDAESMAQCALNELVSSFFLIMGPVGVPVNALVGDGSSLDVTQISRKAAFRILKSLLKVRGRPRFRNECINALQKLVHVCKGEASASGVAGAVAGRRKALLKEIFDTVSKSMVSLGGVVGTPSAAA